jgi:transposase
MAEPMTRLDLRELRRRLREIGSRRKSGLPEKVKLRLRIVSWYGRRRVEEICRFFQISKAWFYRLLNTFLREGLAGLMKKPGRPKVSTIPKGIVQEIHRVRLANPRIGSRRIKWLLGLNPHHTTIHRILQALGLVKKRPYRRRVWKRFRAEKPNQRWQID